VTAADLTTPFTCTKCKQIKQLGEFYESPYRHDRPRQPCKACISKRRRERYIENNGIDEAYEQVLKRDYGITLTQYNEKVRLQANRCAICRRGETDPISKSSNKPRRLAVDHDHVTNMVRGLLCRRCNLVVWALEDNHTTVDAVRKYIEQWQTTFANGAPL
jgi:hypothetical protein